MNVEPQKKSSPIVSKFRQTISKKKKPAVPTRAGINKPLPLPFPFLSVSTATFRQDIPDDVIYEIVKWLSPVDTLHCSLMCRSIHELCKPLLYTNLYLSDPGSCRSALKLLSRRSDLAHWVKTLVLRPILGTGWSNTDKSVDEGWIVSIIEGLALDGFLSSLKTFKWLGRYRPRDFLWSALRNNCPKLKNISLCITISEGSDLLDAESNLFSFEDLTGFHLTTQILERGRTRVPKNHELPSRLWTMLLEKSPDLEELTLDGACLSDEVWQLKPVFRGRWPRLRKLALGHISALDSSSSLEPAIAEFLDAHSNLEDVSLLGNASYSQYVISEFLSLPKMRSWSGRLAQLKYASSECQIRNLCLTDWFSPKAKVGDILKCLSKLEELSIYVNFVDKAPEWDFYEQLLTGCPRLRHLEISATSPLSLTNLPAPLRLVPKLRTFVVTRCPKISSDPIGGVSLIASQNLNLSTIVVRDVLNWEHQNQLSGIYKTKRIGTYYVVVGGANHPNRLMARESGITLGKRYSKKFVHDLVLPHPQV